MCGLDEDSRNSDGWGSHYRFAASHLATMIQAMEVLSRAETQRRRVFQLGASPQAPQAPCGAAADKNQGKNDRVIRMSNAKHRTFCGALARAPQIGV